MIQAGKAVYTFNPNTQDSEPGGPLRSSSAWSTYPVQAEPRLHSKIIVPTTNDAPFAKFKFKKKIKCLAESSTAISYFTTGQLLSLRRKASYEGHRAPAHQECQGDMLSRARKSHQRFHRDLPARR